MVISSRVRLARNLRNVPFPGWAGDEECAKVWEDVCGAVRAAHLVRKNTTTIEMTAKAISCSRGLQRRKRACVSHGASAGHERSVNRPFALPHDARC